MRLGMFSCGTSRSRWGLVDVCWTCEHGGVHAGRLNLIRWRLLRRSYVAGPAVRGPSRKALWCPRNSKAVPYPSEPYPWIDLLQLGVKRLSATT